MSITLMVALVLALVSLIPAVPRFELLAIATVLTIAKLLFSQLP